MKSVKVFFYVLFLAAALYGEDVHASDADAAQVIALEKMWNQVQMARDWQALDKLIGDRFLGTYSSGRFGRKADFIDHTKHSNVRPAHVTIHDLTVEVYGDTAIVVGVYRTQGTDNSKSFDEVGRFTDTWVRSAGKWQCVAAHASVLEGK